MKDVNVNERLWKAEVEGSALRKKKRGCDKEELSPWHAVISTLAQPLGNELLSACLKL